MANKKKVPEKMDEESEAFAFRVKMGDYEVEIKGKHADVTQALENLPSWMGNVKKAFDSVKPKAIATLTVKTEPAQNSKSEETSQSFPKIASSVNVEDAVLKILETDWGKWRPRTMEELKDTMRNNGLKFSDNALSDALKKLGDKGMVRRWNTNTGFVYILGEEKRLASGEAK